ncbi:hypothetical protein OF83DRAFT_671492 [Amylostereum chailletii]|nr:hypothetical protein OF83DRAFT_671492 [Amylostereum chailletii]
MTDDASRVFSLLAPASPISAPTRTVPFPISSSITLATSGAFPRTNTQNRRQQLPPPKFFPALGFCHLRSLPCSFSHQVGSAQSIVNRRFVSLCASERATAVKAPRTDSELQINKDPPTSIS